MPVIEHLHFTSVTLSSPEIVDLYCLVGYRQGMEITWGGQSGRTEQWGESRFGPVTVPI